MNLTCRGRVYLKIKNKTKATRTWLFLPSLSSPHGASWADSVGTVPVSTSQFCPDTRVVAADATLSGIASDPMGGGSCPSPPSRPLQVCKVSPRCDPASGGRAPPPLGLTDLLDRFRELGETPASASSLPTVQAL